MISTSSLLLLLVWSACCMIPTNGRLITDEDPDADVEWPVLCPPDTFYSLKQDECVTCSRCPINKIIINPCQGLHDTRCGPFYDFHSSLSSQPSGAEDKFPKDESESSHQHRKQTDNSKPKSVDSFDRSSNLLHSSSDNTVFSDSEWKSLTIALIVLVSIVFVVVVTFITYFLRRNFMNKTKIVCEYSSPPENV